MPSVSLKPRIRLVERVLALVEWVVVVRCLPRSAGSWKKSLYMFKAYEPEVVSAFLGMICVAMF